jgi:hypothetical protein
MTYRFESLIKIIVVIGAWTFIAPAVRASEDAIGCVKEMTMPGYQGLVSGSIPAVVKVDVLIGGDGRAKRAIYNTPIEGFRAELDDYFVKRTRYSNACEGRTITFFVSYELQKNPAAITEVRFGPPDQIVIVCRRPVVALDPIRSYKLERKQN